MDWVLVKIGIRDPGGFSVCSAEGEIVIVGKAGFVQDGIVSNIKIDMISLEALFKDFNLTPIVHTLRIRISLDICNISYPCRSIEA